MEKEINDGVELSSPQVGPSWRSQLREPALLWGKMTRGWKVLQLTFSSPETLSTLFLRLTGREEKSPLLPPYFKLGPFSFRSSWLSICSTN